MENENRLDMYCFYHGYARYAQWGAWEHVFTACYDDNEKLQEYTDNLCSSDLEAIEASRKINELVRTGEAFIGHDKNPVIALQKCIVGIDKYLKTY